MLLRIAKRTVVLAALGTALLAQTAVAAPAVTGEFDVPGLGGNNKIAPGPDGNMWVTVNDGEHDVAKITPAGAVTEYKLGAITASGIAAGPEGRMWLTRNGGVTSFDPSDPEGANTPTAIPAITGAHSIVLGPDGNFWVATDNALVRINPADNTFKAFPDPGLAPKDIDVAGSLLAIADFGTESVVTATTGDPPVFSPLKVGGNPQGVAGGPAGQIAYTEPVTPPKTIGLFTPPGAPLLVPVEGEDPFGIALGADGAYWAAEGTFDKLLRITTSGQISSLPGFAKGSRPRQIAAGPGNTLWVTLEEAKKVARVSGVEPLVTPIKAPSATTPDTTIDTGPKALVKTRRKRAKIRFRFSSESAGAGFECALRRRRKGGAGSAPFQPCSSPRKYRVRPGRYVFQVRAVLAGVVDPSPAKRSFRVVRVPRR